MDEFTEPLVLIQTLRQASFPGILMDSGYWKGLISWMKKKMLKEHYHISPKDLKIFIVVDKPEDAVKIIVGFRESKGCVGIELSSGTKKE
jgi:predicted Rossmann-fold nucleotide-binding protein